MALGITFRTYWATDIDKRRSDQAHTEFDLEGSTQQLLVFFLFKFSHFFCSTCDTSMICSSSHIEGAFLSARESSMVISQSSHVRTGQTFVVHYVQRARKVGRGGVQLIRWEGGGWAADNSMAISQAGSLQLIDPPNCIPHCLTVSLSHILSCTFPIPSSWHHNSAP